MAGAVRHAAARAVLHRCGARSALRARTLLPPLLRCLGAAAAAAGATAVAAGGLGLARAGGTLADAARPAGRGSGSAAGAERGREGDGGDRGGEGGQRRERLARQACTCGPRLASSRSCLRTCGRGCGSHAGAGVISSSPCVCSMGALQVVWKSGCVFRWASRADAQSGWGSAQHPGVWQLRSHLDRAWKATDPLTARQIPSSSGTSMCAVNRHSTVCHHARVPEGAPASPRAAAPRHSLTAQSRAPVAAMRPQGAQAQPQITRACARGTRAARRKGASAPAGAHAAPATGPDAGLRSHQCPAATATWQKACRARAHSCTSTS